MDASRSSPSSEGTDSLPTREGEGGGATAFAWLIEAPGQRYLGTRCIAYRPEFYWTVDAAKATRFFSREQADGVAAAVRALNPDLWGFALTLGEARLVEHGWLSGAIADTSSPNDLAREASEPNPTRPTS